MNQQCCNNNCKDEALSLSDYCWLHIADKNSYIHLLEQHNKDAQSMKGFNLKHLNAPSINLRAADLSGANLALSILRSADLSQANLSKAELTGCDLSDCDLTAADLSNCHLLRANLSRSRLLYANLKQSNLSEANLEEAELMHSLVYGTSLYHSNLKNAKFITKENFYENRHAYFSKDGVNENGARSARESYTNLKQYFLSCGRMNDASWASYKESRMETKLLRQDRRLGFIPFMLMGILCGWGERPFRAFLSAAAIVFLSAAYFYFSDAIFSTSVSAQGKLIFSDYLYYSLVTFTTLGYGDLLPKANISFRLLAGLEAFSGIFMMGLFVFSLGKRFSLR